MSCLCCLWLFACGGVQHIIVLCLVFLRLVSPMSPVSLDCPFLISPSVFSNVHLQSTKLSTIECGISIYLQCCCQFKLVYMYFINSFNI